MKFIVLIYSDNALIDTLPDGRMDTLLHQCFTHTDELQRDGKLLESQMLAEGKTAKTLRVRNGRSTTLDGPFTETKELLAGFNLIEARDMEEALEIASHFPWAQTGSIEVRPVMDLDAVKEGVNARVAQRGDEVAQGSGRSD
jgi:hypothetical protein